LSSARLVVISRNPHSGKSASQERVAELERQLLGKGFRVEVPDSIAGVCALAEQGVAQGELRAVIAGGGDGTLNLLVNKLPAAVPFLGFPLGTENLVAKYLGWSAEPRRVCDLLQTGRIVNFDAGQANEQIFLVMFSCGLDADVVHRLHSERRGHITHASYLKPIFQALRRYRYAPFGLRAQGSAAMQTAVKSAKSSPVVEAATARWLFVSNLPNYAGQIGITPQATPTDGLLDWCAFQGGSFFSSLRYLFSVLLRSHPQLRDCLLGRCEGLTAAAEDSTSPPIPYQIDGDPGGFLPVDIKVLPGRFRAIVEQHWNPKTL